MGEQPRSQLRMSMKGLCISVLIIGVTFAFLFSDSITVQMQGVYYFMENTDTKYNHVITPDLNSYSVQINLDDLDSNEGKVLYSNDGVQVKVERVYKSETGDSKQYIVEFHSFPKYSASHCEFISFFPSGYGKKGSPHSPINQSKCSINYNGTEYDGVHYVSVAEAEQTIGLGLFPMKAVKDGVLKNAHGTVMLTVSNLYLHTWEKK